MVKDYLAILHLAAQEGESRVDEALRLLLDQGRPPDAEPVTEALRQGQRPSAVTDVMIVDVDLTMYDRLLEPKEDHERHSATDPKSQLIDNLKELHLPAMRSGFEEVAQRAQQESQSYERYLLELTERECQAPAGEPDRAIAARIRGCRWRRRWSRWT